MVQLFTDKITVISHLTITLQQRVILRKALAGLFSNTGNFFHTWVGSIQTQDYTLCSLSVWYLSSLLQCLLEVQSQCSSGCSTSYIAQVIILTHPYNIETI